MLVFQNTKRMLKVRGDNNSLIRACSCARCFIQMNTETIQAVPNALESKPFKGQIWTRVKGSKCLDFYYITLEYSVIVFWNTCYSSLINMSVLSLFNQHLSSHLTTSQENRGLWLCKKCTHYFPKGLSHFIFHIIHDFKLLQNLSFSMVSLSKFSHANGHEVSPHCDLSFTGTASWTLFHVVTGHSHLQICCDTVLMF